MVYDIGLHCSKAECHQKDFLPFECDCCNKVFCLEHRSYVAHTCPSAGSKDHRIIHCPLCKAGIRLTDNENPNDIWESHARSNCNPQDYEKRKKKKERCTVAGCREILTFSNKIQCSDCRQTICLRHRFPADHQCPKQVKVNKSKAQQKKPVVKANSDSCPICKKKFRYVSQLVAHVDREHAETSASSSRRAPSNSSSEHCPQCRATFSDVGQLIRHVEQAHTIGNPVSTGRSSSRKDCIIS